MARDEFSEHDIGAMRAGLTDELMSGSLDLGDADDWLDWDDLVESDEGDAMAAPFVDADDDPDEELDEDEGDEDDDDDDVTAAEYDEGLEDDDDEDEDIEDILEEGLEDDDLLDMLGCDAMAGELLLRRCQLEHMGDDIDEVFGDDAPFIVPGDELGFSLKLGAKVKGVGHAIAGTGRSAKRAYQSKTLKKISKPVKAVLRNKYTKMGASAAMNFPPAAPYAGAVLAAHQVVVTHDKWRKSHNKKKKKKAAAAARLIENTYNEAKAGDKGAKRMMQVMAEVKRKRNAMAAAAGRKARLVAKLNRKGSPLHRPVQKSGGAACPIQAVTPMPGYFVSAGASPRVTVGRFSKAS